MSDIRKALAELVAEQAEDEGLWFAARTAPEAYLQQELRRLHAAIEQQAEPPVVPLGWKLVLVNEGFDGLVSSLERAHRKGYMPDAITEDYEGFDYRLQP